WGKLQMEMLNRQLALLLYCLPFMGTCHFTCVVLRAVRIYPGGNKVKVHYSWERGCTDSSYKKVFLEQVMVD
ncbi:hypothetical protein, partial [Enterobacter cloacae complex sp. 2DZ2F20B]|uniref:hypothetical protein n=1 Tax=Enterobacter cloacae complex sp. 2DZ2F20B TaxID=2511993 RepID=UPI001CA5B466